MNLTIEEREELLLLLNDGLKYNLSERFTYSVYGFEGKYEELLNLVNKYIDKLKIGTKYEDVF